MISVLRHQYHKLPLTFRKKVRENLNLLLKIIGILYAQDYFRFYKDVHHLRYFAGNLLLLKDEYKKSTDEKRQFILEQFPPLLKALVMKNGVKKITLPARYNKLLEKVLPDERFKLKKGDIKVLDIPSSIGGAGLEAYSILNRYYTISSFVLGDLFFNIIYDRDRECIFDEDGNLLQVKLKKLFFSIYQPYTSGYEYTIITYWLMLPFHLISWWLKIKYKYRPNNNCCTLVLTHPEVDSKLSENSGVLRLKKMDAMEKIDEKFDIIMSFNLLLKRYFTRDQINRGIENLGDGLNEDGLLIVGDDDAFTIFRKSNGKLVTIEKLGEF